MVTDLVAHGHALAAEQVRSTAVPRDVAVLRAPRVDALSCLVDEQRRAVELSYFRGWSCPDIARETGASAHVVQDRIRRALVRLRALRDADAG